MHVFTDLGKMKHMNHNQETNETGSPQDISEKEYKGWEEKNGVVTFL